MLKVIVILAAVFGAFMALNIFLPTSTHTAFVVSGYHVPWYALGVCAVGYIAYKIIK